MHPAAGELTEPFYEVFGFSGKAVAKFISPVGEIRGPGRVRIMPNGEISVTMKAEEIEDPSSEDTDALTFLGELRNPTPSRYGQGGNECESICINGERISFRSIGKQVIYNSKYDLTPNNTNTEITFYVVIGEFYSGSYSPQVAAYFSSPLHGFQGPYHESARVILDHPTLRWKSPLMTIEITENGTSTKKNTYQQVTRFTVNGKNGFVQPIVGSDDNGVRLINKLTGSQLSALLTIECDPLPHDWEVIENKFPFDIFPLLSLSSGSFVGSPLIILLNSKGELFRAFYVQISMSKRLKCYSPFNAFHELCCTKLISEALYSSSHLPLNIRVCINSLLKCGISGITIEDQFYFVCRSVEAIWKEVRSRVPHDMSLPEDVSLVLKSGLTRVKEQLESIDSEAALIILKRLQDIGKRTYSFSEIIIALLEMFGFPDQLVLKSKRWLRDINKHRNASVHGGCPSLDPDRQLEPLRSLHHLQDIVVRVLLKFLNYSGHYQPPCVRFSTSVPLDRLNASSSPKALGYDNDQVDQ